MTITVTKDDLIEDLKYQISIKEKLTEDFNIQVTYAGKILKDDIKI